METLTDFFEGLEDPDTPKDKKFSGSEVYTEILSHMGCNIKYSTIYYRSWECASDFLACKILRSPLFISHFTEACEELFPGKDASTVYKEFYPFAMNLIFIKKPNYMVAIEDSSLHFILNYKLYNDISSASYFYDLGRDGFNFELPNKVAKLLTVKQKRDYFANNSIPAKIEYDPHKARGLMSAPYDTGMNWSEINIYQPPRWRNTETVLDISLFEEFIEHLLPKKNDREYVFSWIYSMLTGRNQTILHLQSAQGTGKNIFSTLLCHLVGDGNHDMAREDLPIAKFNAILDRKQLLILDEFVCISNDSKNGLKRLTNDKVPIEYKYGSQTTIENKCNLVITCNSKRQVWVEPDDRRFSIPKVTDSKLASLWEEETIDRFLISFDDSRFIYSIFKYIEANRIEDFSPAIAYQKEAFWDIVYESCRTHIRHMIDTLLKAEIVEVEELRVKFERKKNMNNKFPTDNEIIYFFEKYKHLGSYKVCDIETKESGLLLKPTQEVIQDETTFL